MQESQISKTIVRAQLRTAEDVRFFRPQSLTEFVGQGALKKNLDIFISAAAKRMEPLDHVLLYGPPGLGKTTLSQIIAHELAVGIKITSGPALSKVGDLAAILTNVQRGEVLFIDEIHRLNTAVEELLYSAMEDFTVDLIIGSGPSARTMRIDLQPFTLVGATTRLGLLSNPLRDRFGIPIKLDFYMTEELQTIVKNCAVIQGITITPEAIYEIAKRARGTPRIAIRLFKRVRDFVSYIDKNTIDYESTLCAMSQLGIDSRGLDALDYKYLIYVATNYNSTPVGVETIAAALSEDKDTIEEAIEPYLIQIGFLQRTSRGRALSELCLQYINSKDAAEE